MQFERVDTGRAIAETEFEKNIEKSFQRVVDQLVRLFKKGILFSDNQDAYIGSLATSAVAGTESAIAHGLARIPTGYIVMSRDKAAIIYDGTTAWTSSNIYIRSDVATVAIKIMVF